MLCQFLPYSKVNQLYIYIHPLFYGSPSHLGHHRILNRVPCAIQQDLVVYPSYMYQFASDNPKLPVLPSPTPLICFLNFYFNIFLEQFWIYRKIAQKVQRALHVPPLSHPYPLLLTSWHQYGTFIKIDEPILIPYY